MSTGTGIFGVVLIKWVRTLEATKSTYFVFVGSRETYAILPCEASSAGTLEQCLYPFCGISWLTVFSSELTSKIIFVQGYEDDEVLMVQGKFTHFVADVMNVNLHYVKDWWS